MNRVKEVTDTAIRSQRFAFMAELQKDLELSLSLVNTHCPYKPSADYGM